MLELAVYLVPPALVFAGGYILGFAIAKARRPARTNTFVVDIKAGSVSKTYRLTVPSDMRAEEVQWAMQTVGMIEPDKIEITGTRGPEYVTDAVRDR